MIIYWINRTRKKKKKLSSTVESNTIRI